MASGPNTGARDLVPVGLSGQVYTRGIAVRPSCRNLSFFSSESDSSGCEIDIEIVTILKEPKEFGRTLKNPKEPYFLYET